MSNEDLEILTEEVIEEEQPVSEDECIQVKKPVKKPIYKKFLYTIKKVKKYSSSIYYRIFSSI